MSGSVPYLAAGFGLTWIVLAVYAWRVESRLEGARDRLERYGGSTQRVRAPGGEAAGEPAAAEANDGPEEAR